MLLSSIGLVSLPIFNLTNHIWNPFTKEYEQANKYDNYAVYIVNIKNNKSWHLYANNFYTESLLIPAKKCKDTEKEFAIATIQNWEFKSKAKVNSVEILRLPTNISIAGIYDYTMYSCIESMSRYVIDVTCYSLAEMPEIKVIRNG
jgi:hypothetical protein